MFPLRKLSGFFLCSALYYALLMVPWPGLMQGYRAFFRAGGDQLFHSFGGTASVNFEPLSSTDHSTDTTLVLKKGNVRGSMDINSGYIGYRPTAFLVALVLATPVPWRRRLMAVCGGLILINAFIAFRIWLQLMDAFSDENVLAIYRIVPFWKSVLHALALVLFRAPAAHYVVPMFIWMIVTFRRGDLRGLIAQSKTTGNRQAV